MPDIRDYVRQYADVSFADQSFGVLDSLLFSQVCYMPFEGLLDDGASCAMREAASFLRERFPAGLEDPFQNKRYDLTLLCADTARFGGVLLRDYINHIDVSAQTQFSATTFDTPSDERCVAYRGTDLTLVGWREDMNMSFMVVPAQERAADYLAHAIQSHAGGVTVNGHSKGGNLAMFAASAVAPEQQDRVLAVHTFDGQGLEEETFRSAGYARVTPHIFSYVPQGSLVGLLLCYHPVYTVVRSDAAGIWQHDAITWQTQDASFQVAPKLNATSVATHEAIEKWLADMSKEDRKLLVDTLFQIVNATNTETVDQLSANWRDNGGKMLAAIRDLDPPTKRAVRGFLHMLFTVGANTAMRGFLPGLLRVVFGTSQHAAPEEAMRKERERLQGELTADRSDGIPASVGPAELPAHT